MFKMPSNSGHFARFAALACLVAGAAACGPEAPPPAACQSWSEGALVITEVMPNPEGTDTGSEWFEVHNPGIDSLPLKGVTIVIGKAAGTEEKTHRIGLEAVVPPGGFYVFSDFRDGSAPEWAGYLYADKVKALPNTGGGYVAVRCGSTTISEATYATAPDGKSWSFDGAREPTSDGTKDPAAWCESRTDYDGKNKGTPAAPNDTCGTISGSTCLDVDSGSARDVAPPLVGDLVITEVMADPSAAGDDNGEWIEVYARNAFDLNGVGIQVGDGAARLIESADCLRVAADSYVLLAKRADPLVNGGLQGVGFTFTQSLANAGGTITFKVGDTVLDALTYPGSSAGKSYQLDASVLSSSENDDASKWCNAKVKPAEPPTADYGSPGQPNGPCEGTGPVNDTCSDGGTTRDVVVPAPGDLVISEFMANPKTIDDSKGEWIELTAKAAVDLNGIELANESTGRSVINANDCISLGVGERVVFVRSTDPLQNGGIENASGSFSFGLANSGTRAVVVRRGLVEIDRAPYTAVTEGASSQVDPSKVTAPDNDDPANWCRGIADYGTSGVNKGTPAAENSACTN